MAGFAGYFKLQGTDTILNDMGKAIEHRGPDYQEVIKSQDLALIYKGLKTSYRFEGKESFENQRYVVLINGSVKNTQDLFQAVYPYSKQENMTPAQAIALMLDHQGLKNCARLLHGHFIVLIYDKHSQALHFIRDRLGVQPLYYQQIGEGLLFASEAKALLQHPLFQKQLNQDALRPYLIFQSPTLQESFFKEVYKPSPASVSTFHTGNIQSEKYWDVSFESHDISLDEAIDKINHLIGQNIDDLKHDYADFDQVGSYLSGGVDSSYIVARVRPKNTFTVGYNDEKFSEINNAAALSEHFNIDHRAERIGADQSFAALTDIQYMMDEPLANLSAIPMYFLSQLTSQYTSLAFSGEGSDEFFGGYLDYQVPHLVKQYKKIVPATLRNKLGQLANHQLKDFKGKNFLSKGQAVEDWYIGQANIFHENQANALLKESYRQGPRLNDIVQPYYDRVQGESDLIKKQYLDFHLWLINDINLKADRMNMAHSVQVLMPIFDIDVLNFSRTLPEHLKVQEEKGKIAFREAALQYLPDEWAQRPKLGFPVPVRHWLQDEKYLSQIETAFQGEIAHEFFHTDELQELIELNRRGKSYHRKIWTLYMFIIWYEEYFVKR